MALRVGLLGFHHVPGIPFQINAMADSEAPSQEVALRICKPSKLSAPKSFLVMLFHQ